MTTFSNKKRWSSSSSSPMSLAHSRFKNEIFTWVGIIQFIPNEVLKQEISHSFREFAKMFVKHGNVYNANIHWGKVDLDFVDGENFEENLEIVKNNISNRCDVERFIAVKKVLDPKGVLGNGLIESLFKERN